MFRNRLLSRVAVTGEYRSPNVCFIDDEKDKPDGQDENEADDQDEGSEEPEGDGDEVEDAEDEDEEDSGGETGDREERRTRDEGVLDEKPKRKSASDVIRENKRRRQDAERRLEAAERRSEEAVRRAEAAERAISQRQQTETAQQRQERLALLSPEERFEVLRQEDRVAHAQEMNSVKFQIWDSTDSAKFERLVERDPLVARVADKVETRYADLQRAGSPVSREILADIEVGKMMRANQKAAGTKQRKRADEGVRRETTRPRRVSSDATANRSRRGQEDTPEARRRRLENVIL